VGFYKHGDELLGYIKSGDYLPDEKLSTAQGKACSV
jgi:hypothetical protein